MNLDVVLVGNIIEIFIIYHFWFSTLELRFDKKKSKIAYFVIHGLCIINNMLMLMNNKMTLKTTVSTVFAILTLAIFFKDKWYKKLVIYGTYMICAVTAETLAFIIAKYVYGYNDFSNITNDVLKSYLWQGTIYIFIFMFTIIAFMLFKKKKINPDNRVTQYIYLYILVQCLMTLLFTAFVYEYKITSSIMFCTLGFILISSVIIGGMIYRAAKVTAVRAAEAEYIKKEAEIKDRHFAELRNQYIEYRKLRHDFYNHIKVINEIDEPQKMKAYIGDIKEKFDRMEQVSYCNNLTLDALLSLKKNEAEENLTDVSYRIGDIEDILISDFDLCTVVSNLMDNAISATVNIKNSYIKLDIDRKLDRLIIKLVNSSLPVDEELKTTKSDKVNHGIGIGNIRDTAEKYDGDVFFKYADGEFVSIINMSCSG